MTVRKIFVTIVIILLVTLVGLFWINFSTIIHEFGHMATALVLGCKAGSNANFFTGLTKFICEKEIKCNTDLECQKISNKLANCMNGSCTFPVRNILIAFGGILAPFFVALIIWLFAGENSILRVLALIMFFYSVIPSAFPLLEGSDMSYIVRQGFPGWIAWLIFTVLIGAAGWLIINEVTDREYFKRWTG